jgi:hypothetical protein
MNVWSVAVVFAGDDEALSSVAFSEFPVLTILCCIFLPLPPYGPIPVPDWQPMMNLRYCCCFVHRWFHVDVVVPFAMFAFSVIFFAFSVAPLLVR